MEYRRLKNKKRFSAILKNGKRAYSETLTLVYLPAKETAMAVCVGKKYGKSVQRNRIKRLLREAFRPFAAEMKPCEVLLIPRVADAYSFARFFRDVGKLLGREKLIESQPRNNLRAEP